MNIYKHLKKVNKNDPELILKYLLDIDNISSHRPNFLDILEEFACITSTIRKIKDVTNVIKYRHFILYYMRLYAISDSIVDEKVKDRYLKDLVIFKITVDNKYQKLNDKLSKENIFLSQIVHYRELFNYFFDLHSLLISVSKVCRLELHELLIEFGGVDVNQDHKFINEFANDHGLTPEKVKKYIAIYNNYTKILPNITPYKVNHIISSIIVDKETKMNDECRSLLEQQKKYYKLVRTTVIANKDNYKNLIAINERLEKQLVV